MARYPSAIWRPLPEDKTQTAITPRTVIVHSAVTKGGADSLYPYFSRTVVTLESHFYVTRAGRVEQYIDTERRADANYKANAFAVSIETEDLGDPDTQPWTDAQLWALERLIRWICTTHRIPLRRCPSWLESGIGFHTMWGAPSNWTPVAKTCPGKARIAQFDNELMPRLTEEDLDATEHQLLVDLHAWMSESGKPMAMQVAALIVKVDALTARVDGLEAADKETVKQALREGTG